MRTPPPYQQKERDSPDLFVHGGDGQISGGSHVAASVLVDIAAGERDFCAASNVGASTLPQRKEREQICPWGRWTGCGGLRAARAGRTSCTHTSQSQRVSAVHGGDGQISGGSHPIGSVFVDIAAGERDFCAASNVGASTLPQQKEREHL